MDFGFPKDEPADKCTKRRKMTAGFGADIAKLDMGLLKKVEELTLYAIEQNKLIQLQNSRIEALEKKIEKRGK